MLGRNIKYFRLKNNVTVRELAVSTELSQSVIKNYESGKALPVLQEIRKIASFLGVSLSWLMSSYNHYDYEHEEFRKHSRFSKRDQEFVRLSVEDYFDRFLTLLQLLGKNVMRDVSGVHSISPTGDVENDGLELRRKLGFALTGAISNLVGNLEDRGILVFLLPYDNDYFSGMNGFVSNRPYVVLSSNMTAERQRSTLAHELGHIFFTLPNKKTISWEKYMTALSGAFLFPASDVLNELGEKRRDITSDMLLVSREYGISLQILAKRAQVCKVISDSVYKNFNIMCNRSGLRKNEPSHIKKEESTLFLQYVLRAVNEEKITRSKSVELLRKSYSEFEDDLSLISSKSLWK